MSTHSRIGIQNEDGTIRSIYCHFDGYLDEVGKTLFEHYQLDDKINTLMDLGDISSLGPEIGEKHDFNEYNDNYVNAYGRDRGETDIDAWIAKNEEEFFKQISEEYAYLYQNGQWYYVSCSGLELLAQELIESE